MGPRFNEPLFNEVLDIMNDILGPSQSYSKMYGIEPRYNEPRYNEFRGGSRISKGGVDGRPYLSMYISGLA